MKTYCKVLVASLFASNMTAHAVGIDCESQSMPAIERHICDTPELAIMDESLALAYDFAEIVATDKAYLEEFSDGHYADRDDICGMDTKCLTTWYDNRISNYLDWENVEIESQSGGH